MSKPTVATLDVRLTNALERIVQLEALIATLNRSAPIAPRNYQRINVKACIDWLNANAPKKSYTKDDLAHAQANL